MCSVVLRSVVSGIRDFMFLDFRISGFRFPDFWISGFPGFQKWVKMGSKKDPIKITHPQKTPQKMTPKCGVKKG